MHLTLFSSGIQVNTINGIVTVGWNPVCLFPQVNQTLGMAPRPSSLQVHVDVPVPVDHPVEQLVHSVRDVHVPVPRLGGEARGLSAVLGPGAGAPADDDAADGCPDAADGPGLRLHARHDHADGRVRWCRLRRLRRLLSELAATARSSAERRVRQRGCHSAHEEDEQKCNGLRNTKPSSSKQNL